MSCSVAQCLEVIGEWWTMLIVRDAFMGIRRFDDFQARTGISRNVLTARLEHLVEHGILERQQYQDRPPRHEYVLTDKGRDLWQVLTAMREWGDRWVAPDGAPVEIVHRACDHVAHTTVTCDHCGGPLDARAVRAVPGPGARSDSPL